MADPLGAIGEGVQGVLPGSAGQAARSAPDSLYIGTAMKVWCAIEEIELENEDGRPIPSVKARCLECDHETESFGTSGASVRRCLVLMREECPEGAHNYYMAEDGEDE